MPLRKMSQLRELVGYVNEKFDDLKQVSVLEAAVNSVKSENEWLKCEVTRLSGLVQQHTVEINDVEQYS